MQKYTIAQLQLKYGCSNSKIRRLIAKGLLPTIKEKVDNHPVTIVLVESEQKIKELLGDQIIQINQVNHQIDDQSDKQDNQKYTEAYQEAEIIENKTGFQVMSMEQASFDQLIESIKVLADNHLKSEKESYKKLEDQYFELKASNTQLQEKYQNQLIELVQTQAQTGVLELRIKELDNKQVELNNKIIELEEQNRTLKNEKDDLYSTYNETINTLEDCKRQLIQKEKELLELQSKYKTLEDKSQLSNEENKIVSTQVKEIQELKQLVKEKLLEQEESKKGNWLSKV